MDDKDNRITFGVIGAGIAGLSATLFLAKLGIKNYLYEKRDSKEIGGVGIQLSPNALRSIAPLNILDDLLSKSYYPERLIVSDAYLAGELSSLVLKDTMYRKFGFPYITSSRNLLHNILLKRASSDPMIEIFFGSKISSIKKQNNLMTCKVKDGKTISFKNILICDGIRSSLANFNVENEMALSESIVLRACISGKDLPSDILQNINLWMGKRFHVVSYPINNNLDLNVVMVKKSHFQLKKSGNILRHVFEPNSLSVKNQGLSILLQNIDTWSIWPLYPSGIIKGIQELYTNSSLRLGDAGHPLYPHLAQGAALALEDSHTLYKLLVHDIRGQSKKSV